MKDSSAIFLIEKYCRLLKSIEVTAQQCGRPPSEISLVVVSKGHLWSELEPLYKQGQIIFAENRLQEALGKIAESPHNIEWHFIGPLQKNKVRKVLDNFALIHSVDSFDLAKTISGYCDGKSAQILLQVNTSGESTKHGIKMDHCDEEIDKIMHLQNLSVEGLMTMAPLTEDENVIRNCFQELRLLRNRLQKHYGGNYFTHLSMGMSNDYKLAIAEGATLLRIGSFLFE